MEADETGTRSVRVRFAELPFEGQPYDVSLAPGERIIAAETRGHSHRLVWIEQEVDWLTEGES